MVFDLIVSALVTVLVVTLTDGILTFFGNGLMNIGYRSAWIGPGGLRPSVRTMILTAAALLSFCLKNLLQAFLPSLRCESYPAGNNDGKTLFQEN